MKKIKFLVLVLAIPIFHSCTNRTHVVDEYYSNGIIKKEIEVKNGMRNGITKTYDERGILTSTAEFVNDMCEGWMITYNPRNGKITAKAFYKNDKQNGPVTLYYATGELYREEMYVDGRVDSIVKTYWPDGKLQAEVYFKIGSPAIGLKEFDKEGNPVKHPHLVIEEINQLARLNTFKLKISLSDHGTDVDYYLGDLIDGKYLDPKAIKVKDADGIATLQYNVLKRHKVSKRLGVTARIRTEYGNTLVLHQIYNLDVSN